MRPGKVTIFGPFEPRSAAMIAANESNTVATCFFAMPVLSATVAYSSLLLRGLLAGVIFFGFAAAAAFFAIVFSMNKGVDHEVPSSLGEGFTRFFRTLQLTHAENH